MWRTELSRNGNGQIWERSEFHEGDRADCEAVRAFEIQVFSRCDAEGRIGFGYVNQEAGIHYPSHY